MKENPDTRIRLLQGDITKLSVDAIVNAANHTLLGGGGVDGAIHRAAGPELRQFCATLGGCQTGQAKLTPGFRLPARHVIHTVGPIWGQVSAERARQLLADCYRNSLQLALEHGLKTVAFPNISTGAYGFPKEEAAKIAVETVRTFLADHPEIEQVYFVCFDDENRRIYEDLLGKKATPVA